MKKIFIMTMLLLETYNMSAKQHLPRYVLFSKHEPGGFKIEASCIDKDFQDNGETVNKNIQFQWGVKYPNKSIEWNTVNSSSIFIPVEKKMLLCFLRSVIVMETKISCNL